MRVKLNELSSSEYEESLRNPSSSYCDINRSTIIKVEDSACIETIDLSKHKTGKFSNNKTSDGLTFETKQTIDDTIESDDETRSEKLLQGIKSYALNKRKEQLKSLIRSNAAYLSRYTKPSAKSGQKTFKTSGKTSSTVIKKETNLQKINETISENEPRANIMEDKEKAFEKDNFLNHQKPFKMKIFPPKITFSRHFIDTNESLFLSFNTSHQISERGYTHNMSIFNPLKLRVDDQLEINKIMCLLVCQSFEPQALSKLFVALKNKKEKKEVTGLLKCLTRSVNWPIEWVLDIWYASDTNTHSDYNNVYYNSINNLEQKKSIKQLNLELCDVCWLSNCLEHRKFFRRLRNPPDLEVSDKTEDSLLPTMEAGILMVPDEQANTTVPEENTTRQTGKTMRNIINTTIQAESTIAQAENRTEDTTGETDNISGQIENMAEQKENTTVSANKASKQTENTANKEAKKRKRSGLSQLMKHKVLLKELVSLFDNKEVIKKIFYIKTKLSLSDSLLNDEQLLFNMLFLKGDDLEITNRALFLSNNKLFTKKILPFVPYFEKTNEISPPPCSHSGPCVRNSTCSCYLNEIYCTTKCVCTECNFQLPTCSCTICTDTCMCLKNSVSCSNCNCTSCFNKNFIEKTLDVKKSQKQGLGLFSTEEIKMNEFIIEYTGEIIDFDSTETRGRAYEKSKCSYVFDVFCVFESFFSSVDAMFLGNKSRFINHSDEPNIEPRNIRDNHKDKILFFALKDIGVGEELFFTYNYPKKKKDMFGIE
ncbi:Histone-lysine N-methyltransferase EZH2 [Cucumispora dikerogammari]|nr:Histone-lysine N-methyltransferase EZH2 [Cucumispora dikerogammari]